MTPAPSAESWRQQAQAYYRHFSRFLRDADAEGSGFAAGTMHRRLLRDPRDPASGDFAYLNELVLAALHAAGARRVIDAGCGWGGLLLQGAAASPLTGVGITISALQRETATRRASELGVGDRLRFLVADYDDFSVPDAPADAVVAVESLIHSPDKAATLRSLAGKIAPGGVLVIVDDMRSGRAAGADGTLLLDRFRNGWVCPTVPTADDHRAMLAELGFAPWIDRDLTAHVALRDRALIERDLANAAGTEHDGDPETSTLISDGLIGGYCLELLYHRGLMEYRLIAAREASAAT